MGYGNWRSGLQTNTPTGKLLWRIVGSIAEFEREMMLERQVDGIAKAKRDGKYLGQRPNAMIQAERIVSLRQSGAWHHRDCRPAGERCGATIRAAISPSARLGWTGKPRRDRGLSR